MCRRRPVEGTYLSSCGKKLLQFVDFIADFIADPGERVRRERRNKAFVDLLFFAFLGQKGPTTTTSRASS